MDARTDEGTLVEERRAKVTLPTQREIVITRIFDAPRSLVFEAWTKSEHVARWWDPGGLPLAECEIDLRVGGEFRFVNSGPEGAKYPFGGRYVEIVAPERIVFVPLAGGDAASTILFEDFERKTKLTITIRCASEEERDALLKMGVGEGTRQTLDNLEVYLGRMA